jgi:hypothetical protein
MTSLLLILSACVGDEPNDSDPVVVDSAPCEVGQEADDMDCDGYTEAEGDCDDSDPYSNPAADDVPYDGKDNDCAGDGDLTDFDGDGYDSDKVGGDDCNDGNPAIFPGAEEVCYDGIDQDCAGDEDSNDCDGDGYPGYPQEEATDCNDNDPAVNPGAEEIWYDGADQNCSGYLDSDYDQDGDGDDSSEHEQSDGTYGTDCDDLDPLTAGGNRELWDGHDRDCDGEVDNLGWADGTSAWSPQSGNNDGMIGFSGGLLPDWDGDGYAEIAMGGYGVADDYSGRVIIISADETGKPGDIQYAKIDGDAGELLGMDMEVVDDLNGDGQPEILVGTPVYGGSGAGLVFSGAVIAGGGEFTSSNRLAVLNGDTYNGFDVTGLSDVDGDGVGELVTGLGWYSTTHVVVYSGALAGAGGNLKAVDAFAQIDGPSGADVGGHSLGGMDFDGDGQGDLLVGAYTSGQGAVIPVTGDMILAGGSMNVADMAWVRGASATDRVGIQSGFIEDLDEDGYDEIIVHGYGHQGSAPTEMGGRIWIIDGDDVPTDDSLVKAEDLAFIIIDGTMDYASVHTPERQADIDGDGVVDLLAVQTGDRGFAWALEGNGPVDAQANILYGADLVVGGTFLADENSADDVNFYGRESDDLMGYTTLVGDLDDDGLGDVVFGAPAAAAEAGQVYAVINHSDGGY